jgi:hypothetical protein
LMFLKNKIIEFKNNNEKNIKIWDLNSLQF